MAGRMKKVLDLKKMQHHGQLSVLLGMNATSKSKSLC